jgi:hypothetical protein
VDYVEPWLAGNARGPSTAFCLLYRLFELKPTEEEVQATITHEDSVYIRAVSEQLTLLLAVLKMFACTTCCVCSQARDTITLCKVHIAAPCQLC